MEHVGREGNKVAHVLARMAVNQNIESVWIDESPGCIRDLIVCE
jgi:hypothetical protein